MTITRAEQRRAARKAENRNDILDAAERVFATHGIQAGSVRKIGAESGFSAAAIYTFFENKQELLAQTLTRRAEELLSGMRGVVADDPLPLHGLHQVIDVTVDFFDNKPEFGQLLHQVRARPTVAAPSLSEFQSDGDLTLLHEATDLIAGLIRDGQAEGSIRAGDPYALAHLCEVLINEFVNTPATATRLTRTELHGFINAALRTSRALNHPST